MCGCATSTWKWKIGKTAHTHTHTHIPVWEHNKTLEMFTLAEWPTLPITWTLSSSVFLKKQEWTIKAFTAVLPRNINTCLADIWKFISWNNTVGLKSSAAPTTAKCYKYEVCSSYCSLRPCQCKTRGTETHIVPQAESTWLWQRVSVFTWNAAERSCRPSCMFCCSWFWMLIFFSLVSVDRGNARITACSPTEHR